LEQSMDILYHHRTQGTGAESVHSAYIIKGFRDLGFNVHVVSPNDADPVNTAGSNPFTKKDGLKSKLLTTLSRSLPQLLFEVLEIGYNPIAYLKLNRVISRRKIRFIYERNAFFLFAGAYLAKKYRVPYVVEVNEVAGEKRVRKQIFVNLAKFIERYVFSRADAIIVVSDFLKEKIRENGINGAKIYVMPNGVDAALFNPTRVRKHLRDQWGIDKHTVVMGFIGWFVAWHNLELLIESFSQIAKDRNVALVLVGDGILKKKLQQMARDFTITNKVIFPGAVPYEQVPEYIAMMDICVIPGSNAYRSPIKLFEYMAMEKPVVAPHWKPIQDVIQDGQEGILFSPDDRESLKQSLEFLIGHQEKRQIMGQNARNRIIAKHTWRRNAEQIVAIASKK
jgi:glycosyltransferase involved in cell wall biosynthesis